MWLGCVVESGPFFLGRDTVPFVVWIWKRNTGSRVVLEHAASDSDIEAVLQYDVVVIYCLRAGGCAASLLSLPSVGFNVLWHDVRERLCPEERDQLLLHDLHSVLIAAEALD